MQEYKLLSTDMINNQEAEDNKNKLKQIAQERINKIEELNTLLNNNEFEKLQKMTNEIELENLNRLNKYCF